MRGALVQSASCCFPGGTMRRTLIRTAVLASLFTAFTALAVSAVAYYALPRTNVQADNQGVTLQPQSQPAATNPAPQATTQRPALVRRSNYSGYSAAPSNTSVVGNSGEPVVHH